MVERSSSRCGARCLRRVLPSLGTADVARALRMLHPRSIRSREAGSSATRARVSWSLRTSRVADRVSAISRRQMGRCGEPLTMCGIVGTITPCTGERLAHRGPQGVPKFGDH